MEQKNIYFTLRLTIMFMERVNKFVLFLILVDFLQISIHLSWCWLWAGCKWSLLCCGTCCENYPLLLDFLIWRNTGF